MPISVVGRYIQQPYVYHKRRLSLSGVLYMAVGHENLEVNGEEDSDLMSNVCFPSSQWAFTRKIRMEVLC
jgi:hypothetical protein